MKTHRVRRQADRIFIEYLPGRWMETDRILSHAVIHDYDYDLSLMDEAEREKEIAYRDDDFHNGTIKDWTNLQPVWEEPGDHIPTSEQEGMDAVMTVNGMMYFD